MSKKHIFYNLLNCLQGMLNNINRLQTNNNSNISNVLQSSEEI